jgi:hypothetical protein
MYRLFSWFGTTRPVMFVKRRLSRWASPDLFNACQDLIEVNAQLSIAALNNTQQIGLLLMEFERYKGQSRLLAKSLVLLAGGIIELTDDITEAAGDPLLTLETENVDGKLVLSLERKEEGATV